jgi:hypothetical protein
MGARIEAAEHFGNIAAMPLTFLGYAALAKSLWPANISLSGDKISWPAIVAILLIMVGLITVAAQYAQYRSAQHAHAPSDGAALRFEDVVNQTFKNQEVPLDGYRYVACTFENVTFVYNNGVTGGIDPSSRWTGSVGFKSREARLQQILGFLQSLKIIPPQTTQGLYTPILADLPNPASDAVIINTSDELASYWSRLISARGTSNEKFKDMENTYNLLWHFWHDLEKNRDSPKQKWVEKNLPGQSLTPEKIDEFRETFLTAANVTRDSLITVLNLLGFQMLKLGV